VGRFDGKTVFITGGARGQGRSHALGFAREGANIVVVDVAAPDDTVPNRCHTLASLDDLHETVRLVESEDRRCVGIQADVRDRPAMQDAVGQAVAEFGGIDVVIANHGICSLGSLVDLDDADWDASLDVCMTGTWNTLRAAVPGMLERGAGGRIIVTISGVVRWPPGRCVPYVAAKFGLIGLIKSLSQELMREGITVNGVNPGITNTDMPMNEKFWKYFLPDIEHPTWEDIEPVFREMGGNGEPYMDPEDITDGMLFLASHEARKISGMMLDIAGGTNAMSAG
jgi:NAD(P)-dependent dehydrogenase (short-subunit alcohol dehydrogenase family)